MFQWHSLIVTYLDLGLKVEVIEQEALPDMVFAADQGILFGKHNILLSRFRHAERKAETSFYQKWYEENGFKVSFLPEGIYFEGSGELQYCKDKVLMGVGFRAGQTAPSAVCEMLNRDIIYLELVNDHYYHLDTCLLVLNDQTIFYYPETFSLHEISFIDYYHSFIFLGFWSGILNNVMPYKTNADLPDSVKDNIPSHAQDIYREAFNSAWEQYADPGKRRQKRNQEETAHAVAWNAVEKVYQKNDQGKWKPKNNKE